MKGVKVQEWMNDSETEVQVRGTSTTMIPITTVVNNSLIIMSVTIFMCIIFNVYN